MVFEIEKELAEEMDAARAAGNDTFARCCELCGVRSPPGETAFAPDVQCDSVTTFTQSLVRMLYDSDTPAEHVRMIRLYLAMHGHANSQSILGDNFRLGRNVAQDCAIARYWYEHAARNGAVCAQNNLGVMCAKGYGGECDEEKAVYWYSRAAEKGDGTAKGNLGMHLALGWGVKRDYRRAATLLKESLSGDPYHARNHLLLALCYEHGVGGRSWRRLAIRHYQEAADFGSSDARAALRRLRAGCGEMRR